MQDVFCFPLLDTQCVHSWDDILLQDVNSRMLFWVISDEFKSKCKTRISAGVVNVIPLKSVKACQFVQDGDVPYGYFLHLPIAKSRFWHHR